MTEGMVEEEEELNLWKSRSSVRTEELETGICSSKLHPQEHTSDWVLHLVSELISEWIPYGDSVLHYPIIWMVLHLNHNTLLIYLLTKMWKGNTKQKTNKNSVKGFLFLLILFTTIICSFVNRLSNKWRWGFIVVLVFIPMMINNVELFVYHLNIFIFSFEKCLFRSFA